MTRISRRRRPYRKNCRPWKCLQWIRQIHTSFIRVFRVIRGSFWDALYHLSKLHDDSTSSCFPPRPTSRIGFRFPNRVKALARLRPSRQGPKYAFPVWVYMQMPCTGTNAKERLQPGESWENLAMSKPPADLNTARCRFSFSLQTLLGIVAFLCLCVLHRSHGP